jgi:hypothetical protein
MGNLRLGGCLLGTLGLLGCFGTEEPKGKELPPGTDLSGSWYVQEEVSGNCPGSDYPEQNAYWMEVEQTGSALLLTQDGAAPVEGSLSGSTLTWSGTRQSNSGTVSIEFSGTMSGADAGSGVATWSWTDGSSECSGTTRVTLSKPATMGLALQGTLFGLATDAADKPLGWFAVPLHQRGDKLEGQLRGRLGTSSIGCAALSGVSTDSGLSLGDEMGQFTLEGSVESTDNTIRGTLLKDGIEGTFIARLVQPHTLTPSASTPLAGVDTGLAFDGELLWSAATMASTATDLQLFSFATDGTPTANVELLPYTDVAGLAAADGGFWMLSRGGGSKLTRYSGQPLAASQQLPLTDAMPNGVAASPEWVWWFGGDYGEVLQRAPAAGGAPQELALLGSGSDSLTYFDHSLWLLASVTTFDCSAPELEGELHDVFVLDGTGTPQALYSLQNMGPIATDGDSLWVFEPSLGGTGTLVTYALP